MLKRYPSSRRIYDTELSCYVSIAVIRPRLLGGETVTENGEDVTSAVLARLIMDECATLTAETLRQFIVSYSSRKSVRKIA